MQLELKHLACYLPYGLKVRNGADTFEITAMNKGAVFFKGGLLVIEDIKPILRPLSDLTKEIEHKGVRFVPVEWFEIGDEEGESLEYSSGNIKLIRTLESIAKHNIHNDINYLPYGVVQKLHEWHFDVFGLIEAGLAVDINTLTK